MASEGTGQQVEAALVVSEEVTAVLEEIVMTVSTGNADRPTNISVLHDYAMEHLFSFLPMTDLKNCRLVNRSWNRASNREILKRDYVIHFGEADGYVTDPHRQRVYRIVDIPKLVQQVHNSFQFPWTKFKVEAQSDSTCTITNLQETFHLQLDNLLRVINPFVTEFVIYHLRIFPNLEYPNLRKLILWYASPEGFPTGSNWTSLLRLVETASKLNEMTFFGYWKVPLYMEILEIPNCRKITQLSLNHWIEGEQLVRISKMGFQLKFLSLSFQLDEVTTESIRAVLLSQSNCLEHLELSCDDDVSSSEEDKGWLLGMEFPRMEKLKVLYVRSDNLYSCISYKDMFPVLKKLTVDGNYVHSYNRTAVDNSFFKDKIEPVETMEYLWFAEEPRSPETILQAARQFPKLRSVSLIVSLSQQNLLNILGNALPLLEEMELSFDRGDNMDAILTGLSSEEVDALKALPADQLDEEERSKQPLRFLKNLKKLGLSHLEGTEIQARLSDFGCRFALLKMEHLQVLEFRGNFNQISDQVMERMREMFVVRLEN